MCLNSMKSISICTNNKSISVIYRYPCVEEKKGGLWVGGKYLMNGPIVTRQKIVCVNKFKLLGYERGLSSSARNTSTKTSLVSDFWVCEPNWHGGVNKCCKNRLPL